MAEDTIFREVNLTVMTNCPHGVSGPLSTWTVSTDKTYTYHMDMWNGDMNVDISEGLAGKYSKVWVVTVSNWKEVTAGPVMTKYFVHLRIYRGLMEVWFGEHAEIIVEYPGMVTKPDPDFTFQFPSEWR